MTVSKTCTLLSISILALSPLVRTDLLNRLRTSNQIFQPILKSLQVRSPLSLLDERIARVDKLSIKVRGIMQNVIDIDFFRMVHDLV